MGLRSGVQDLVKLKFQRSVEVVYGFLYMGVSATSKPLNPKPYLL